MALHAQLWHVCVAVATLHVASLYTCVVHPLTSFGTITEQGGQSNDVLHACVCVCVYFCRVHVREYMRLAGPVYMPATRLIPGFPGLHAVAAREARDKGTCGMFYREKRDAAAIARHLGRGEWGQKREEMEALTSQLHT